MINHYFKGKVLYCVGYFIVNDSLEIIVIVIIIFVGVVYVIFIIIFLLTSPHSPNIPFPRIHRRVSLAASLLIAVAAFPSAVSAPVVLDLPAPGFSSATRSKSPFLPAPSEAPGRTSTTTSNYTCASEKTPGPFTEGRKGFCSSSFVLSSPGRCAVQCDHSI